jgi:SAM-dependent methyltransferase
MENKNKEIVCCSCDPKEKDLGQQFWDNQYQSNSTGWDLGAVSPPLKAYIDQLQNKNLRILIPGCGNTYEAEYLLQQGFTNITLIDIAPTLVNKLKGKFKDNTNINILLGNFFEHNGTYDLILEQTFFCALNPSLRSAYRDKMLTLLEPGGKLAGLLFNKMFDKEGPPFGGSKQEYEQLFKTGFRFVTCEPCHNSVAPRAGAELFVILPKAL